MTITTSGLEGVTVADTVLSEVDGLKGELLLAGLPVAQAAALGYTEMAARLWAPLGQTTSAAELGAARARVYPALAPLWTEAARASPMAGLRLCLSALASTAPADGVAAIAVSLPALARVAAGQAPVAPDPDRDTADDVLRMLHGAPVEPARARAFETYLVTVSDHGLNASTFTARVIASTGAGLMPAVVGALGALEGPLHGGAPGPVLDMLDAIETAENARPWLAHELAAGRRLMGFGHRVYRTRDPRAEVLGQVVEQLAAGAPSARLTLARHVEREALAALARHRPERALQTNVEFYTALVLEAVGLPRALFTSAFALGRVLGWTAHVLEQQQTGRLIRPRARYVGPRPA